MRTYLASAAKTRDSAVAAVYEEGRGAAFGAAAKTLDKAAGGALQRAFNSGAAPPKVGDALLLHTPKPVVMVGAGKKSARIGDGDYRKIIAAAAKELRKTKAASAAFYLDELAVQGRDSEWKARAAVDAVESEFYRFDELKSKPPPPGHRIKNIAWIVPDTARRALAANGLKEGAALAEGANLARDLGNLPGNVCTPTYLAKRALQMRRSHGLQVTVLEERRMAALKMGALLSVSRGSREPAKLIVLKHNGARDPKAPPAVLVGKGLTFDAGGISLKPAANMDEMKYDMCGGASVFGALAACARMRLKLNVVGVIPSSENLPDGAANKPGDIVTSMSGRTIEILNTDAEGRLILCDALTYAARFKPALVVDIATLTGACVVALGAPASGLFSNNQKLAAQLIKSGDAAGDRAWQLPLWDDYARQLDSPFADLANIGGRTAGAVTAACFLAKFTGDFRWAHLDIAGTAWGGAPRKRASGRPVPLLVQFLRDCAGGALRDFF